MFSCANLFFRDVKYITQVILSFAIFFTPVLFEPSMLGERGARLVMLNPLAPILEGLRLVIVEGHNLLVPLMVGLPAVNNGVTPITGGTVSWIAVAVSPEELATRVVLLFPVTSCAVKVIVPSAKVLTFIEVVHAPAPLVCPAPVPLASQVNWDWAVVAASITPPQRRNERRVKVRVGFMDLLDG